MAWLIIQRIPKFMVVNGNDQDRLPIVRGDRTISHCGTYVFLGAIFTADGNVASMIKNRIANKHCNMLKLFAFVQRNRDLTILHEAPCVKVR